MTDRFSRRASLTLSVLSLLAMQCGGGVSNTESARRAYLGLDRAVDRALSLGFTGFNMASSANIPAQMANGDVMGTMAVAGQVSQGAGTNREMRLTVTLANYRDTVRDGADGGGSELRLVYDKPADQNALAMDLSLRPPMFTGTLTGVVRMSGDLEGAVTLNLTMAGTLESVAGMGTQYRRVAGTTRITGTVTSSYGTYMVDVMR